MTTPAEKNVAPTSAPGNPKRTQKIVEISEEFRQEIKDAFNMFDVEETGSIELKQLKCAMRALGFEPKKEEIKKLGAELDKERTGFVAFDDFAALMAKKIEEKGTKEEILKAFQLFDEDNTGKISFENLKKVS